MIGPSWYVHESAREWSIILTVVFIGGLLFMHTKHTRAKHRVSPIIISDESSETQPRATRALIICSIHRLCGDRPSVRPLVNYVTTDGD